MPFNPLTIWVPFALLTLLIRRWRRLRARLPLVGLLGVSVGLAAYVGVRLTLRPGPLREEDGAVLHVLLALGGGFVMLPLAAWGRALVVQDRRRIAAWLRREAAWVGICVLLAAALAGVYFFYGTRLDARGVCAGYDTLFGADPARQLDIVAGTLKGDEQVTHKHPLVPLLGRALGLVAALVVGRHWAPLALSSAAGGLCVALAAFYFRQVTGSRALGALLAILLGSTAAQLVFATIPETQILSAAALILLHLLLAWDGRGVSRHRPAVRFRHQVLAAVLAAGMTVTNAVPALVCFACQRASQRRLRMLLRWVACVTLVGSVFLTLQDFLIPAATLGHRPARYLEEVRFFTVARPDLGPAAASPSGTAPTAGQMARKLLRGLFLENVVGPTPGTTQGEKTTELCMGPFDHWLGRLTAVAWLLIVSGATAVLFVCGGTHRPPTLWAAVISLSATALLHTFYGNDHMFLYSCSFTFYVLGILAHALPHVRRQVVIAVLGAFGVLLVANNAWFYVKLLATLDQVAGAGVLASKP